MTINDLKDFPQTLIGDLSPETKPIVLHESLTRSYQLLNKVIELLELNTPQVVILEIINEVKRGDHWRTLWDNEGNSLTTKSKITTFKEDRWNNEVQALGS